MQRSADVGGRSQSRHPVVTADRTRTHKIPHARIRAGREYGRKPRRGVTDDGAIKLQVRVSGVRSHFYHDSAAQRTGTVQTNRPGYKKRPWTNKIVIRKPRGE